VSKTDVNIKSNATIAKAFDIGQRLFSLFVATALPAITTGAVIGVSVAKSAIMAGAMAVIGVVQKLAAASVDGELTADEIKDAFSNGKTASKPKKK
jgi:hypothetical protein